MNRASLPVLLLVAACASAPDPTPAAPVAATTEPAPTPRADARFDPPYTPVPDDVADPPRFKPSGQSPEPLPITTNAYGAYVPAPGAPQLGDTAPDFTAALASGGTFSLEEARKAGPVLLMFYRGFW